MSGEDDTFFFDNPEINLDFGDRDKSCPSCGKEGKRTIDGGGLTCINSFCRVKKFRPTGL